MKFLVRPHSRGGWAFCPEHQPCREFGPLATKEYAEYWARYYEKKVAEISKRLNSPPQRWNELSLL